MPFCVVYFLCWSISLPLRYFRVAVCLEKNNFLKIIKRLFNIESLLFHDVLTISLELFSIWKCMSTWESKVLFLTGRLAGGVVWVNIAWSGHWPIYWVWLVIAKWSFLNHSFPAPILLALGSEIGSLFGASHDIVHIVICWPGNYSAANLTNTCFICVP